MAKTPKVASTRLSLPLGVAGAEPDDPEGSLAYATDTGRVRVKQAGGWADVSGSGGPPTGPAGGDLSGTYPNPSVTTSAALKSATTNVVTSGATAPSSGQVLTATSSTAAAWQTPSGSPTGAAGGDLAGTYPNPTATQARGLKSATTTVSVSAATAPTSGQVLTATGSTAATWQTPSGSPTGAAGGDLAGTYPNPEVAAIHETSGPTKLTIGSITTGQVLIRSGSTLIGQTGAAPTGSAGGDLSGTYPNPAVAKITTTTGPTSLTVAAIADGDILTRSGSNVQGFTIGGLTQVTSGTSGSKILVENAGVKKYMPVWKTSLNPFIRPPFVASGDDIEATDYPQNLGLSIYNTTDAVSPTWTGEVDPFGTLLTSGSSYRSSNGSGVSWIQIADLKRYVMHKALAASVTSGLNFFWTSIIPPPIDLTSLRTATNVPPKPGVGLFLSKTSGGVPDTNNQLIVGWRDNGGRIEAYASTVIASANTNYLSVTALVISPVADIVGIAINTTDNWFRPFLACSATGQAYFWSEAIVPGNSFMLSLDRWGIFVPSTSGTAFGTNNATGFRFMRRSGTGTVGQNNNWIAGF